MEKELVQIGIYVQNPENASEMIRVGAYPSPPLYLPKGAWPAVMASVVEKVGHCFSAGKDSSQGGEPTSSKLAEALGVMESAQPLIKKGDV
jgi:hypothetical protein